MTTDNGFLFSTNHELLTDVAQFHGSLTNKLISQNEAPIFANILESFNELMKEELRMYKVYDS